jgi:hypothetical protein
MQRAIASLNLWHRVKVLEARGLKNAVWNGYRHVDASSQNGPELSAACNATSYRGQTVREVRA